jgi:dienelactone hydrolase
MSLLMIPVSANSQTLNVKENKKLGGQSAKQFVFQDHFKKQFDAAARQFEFKGATKKDVEEWKKILLPKVKSALGLDKLEWQLAGYVPTAEKIDSEDVGFCIRERWHIWTEPTVPLPVVILYPKNIKGKVPLVITPHGHGKNTEQYAGIYPDMHEKEYAESTHRNVAVQSVMEGYITIAPTTRAFGDTRTGYDKKEGNSFSCHDQLMKDLLVGRTPIGDRVWDMEKIIDWALQNLPVDAKKIAITGNSGGGTVSLFAAACDPRISVAVPGSAFCTFQGSIGSIAHCDCNYIPGILNIAEMADIAGLVSPRAFCAINGIEDNVFPIAETRKAFAHLQQIYSAAGVLSNAELYEGNGGHRYYKEGSWPFIKKHFSQIN